MGRLLQAWLAVQNSARFGLRYAVTGEYNQDYCALAGNALGLSAADVFGTSPAAYDCKVQRAYCESLPPGQQATCDAEQLTAQLEDWARLPSILDAARSGAAGSAIDSSPAISGDYLTYLLTHNLAQLGNPALSGYFHVTICSNRDADEDLVPDFMRDNTTTPETCLNFDANPTVYMDDAGGPGNRVRVTASYVHPMLLPLISSLWPKVPLFAWREGIVEQFRVSRISGVGGQIGIAPTMTATPTTTLTPSLTPTPTDTPTPSLTPTPTSTATDTPTPTPTATPTPACDVLTVNGPLVFNENDLEISLRNTSTNWPVTIGQVSTLWDELEGQPLGPWHDQVVSLPNDQYFDRYEWGGLTILDASPNVGLNAVPTTFNHNLGLNIVPQQSSALGMHFTRSFTSYYLYYHGRDFSVTLDYSVGPLSCPAKIVTGRYGPIVQIAAPPPVPITQPFSVQAIASDPDGTINQVRFEVWNAAQTTILGYQDEVTSPYCLFGDAGGVCLTRGLGNVWPNSSNPIQNGTYVITIQARDNDSPNQYTRIQQAITLNLPALVACNNVGSGLLGEYYEWTGNSPPSFGSINYLTHARIDPVVNFNWGNGSPAPNTATDHFAVRWRGQVQPKYNQPEVYTFYTRTDDGARLWVNGQLLVNRWQDQFSTEWNGSINIPAGCPLLDIVLEYYEHYSTASADLRWESASIAKEIVPRLNLYPPSGPIPATSTPLPTPQNTATFTPSPTPTATNTQPAPPTPTDTQPAPNTPTPTETSIVLITPTFTLSPTATSTLAPSQTPSPSVTPTPCLTPPDLGGCR